MLSRTHLTISVLGILLFINYISGFDSKIVFVVVVLISTFLPDIDSKNSKFGKNKSLRIIQWLAGHRKIFHSFLFLGIVFVLFLLFSKALAFGFLLGYGLHLFADALTIQGIQPLYPLKFKLRGFIRTGKLIENVLFLILVIVNVWFIYHKFF